MGGLNPAHVPYWRVSNPTLWDFCVSMRPAPSEERSVLFLLCPLKARQDPRQKLKRKHPRSGGFEPLHIWRGLGSKPEAQRLIQEATGPLLKKGGLANMDNDCGMQGLARKFLPRCNRIPLQAAFSGGLAAQNERPGFCPVTKGAL